MITRREIPEYSEWGSVLERNLELSSKVKAQLGEKVLNAARIAILEEAHKFEISSGLTNCVKKTTTERIIFSGHQPIIYHSGLLEKAKRLSQIADETDSLGVHIVLDTDIGEQVAAQISDADSVTPKLKSVPITKAAGIYANQVVTGEFSDSKVSTVFSNFKDQSIIKAHIAARSSWEPERNYLAVPLSQILKRTEIWPLLTLPLKGSRKFAEIYNSTLNTHRIVNKIENTANPFPNLEITDLQVEAPFWIIDLKNSSRSKVFIKHESVSVNGKTIKVTELLAELSELGLLLAPRGGWVSGFFRLGLSDLFIHGLGGAKYDPFVDSLVDNWLGVKLPEFVVASADRFLFHIERAEYLKAQTVKANFKDLVARTEKFLGTGLFDAQLEGELVGLVERRLSLVSALPAKSAAEIAGIKRELNSIKDNIREVIERSEFFVKAQKAELSEEAAKAVLSREYSFFCFDEGA